MSLQLVLRVVSARGDKPIRYDATDKAKIKEIIDTVIIPNLEKGWTLFGAKKDEKEPVESESNWQEDIEKLGYYYDDAAGYEVYQDDDDDEDTD